jgi:hypothetical protein
MPSNVPVVQDKPNTHLGRDIALYTAVRIALVGAVTAILSVAGLPLLVSVAIAVILGFPLGLLLFRGLNARVTAGLADRYAERDRLRAELRGETEPDED